MDYESRQVVTPLQQHGRLKMRKAIITASIVALIGTVGVALAEGSDPLNHRAISIEAMKQKIDVLGYDVRRLKVDEAASSLQVISHLVQAGLRTSFVVLPAGRTAHPDATDRLLAHLDGSSAQSSHYAACGAKPAGDWVVD
jgi:hypothetical protein